MIVCGREGFLFPSLCHSSFISFIVKWWFSFFITDYKCQVDIFLAVVMCSFPHIVI
uniref:Uncharacterized protein n=1 Tax=Arundo donax TaxID=35708 RepID=A0A0A9AWH2_ARUDO